MNIWVVALTSAHVFQRWLTSSCGPSTGRISRPSWWEAASSNIPSTWTSSAGTARARARARARHLELRWASRSCSPCPLSSQRSLLPVATWGRPQQTSRCFGGGDIFFFPLTLLLLRGLAVALNLIPPSVNDRERSRSWSSDPRPPIRRLTSRLCSLSPSDSLWRLWLHYSSGRHRRHVLHHQRRTGEEEG